MGETFGYPDLLPVFRTQDFPDPTSESRGPLTQVDGHIEHDSGDDTDQLPLWLPDLIVQATQHVLRGIRMIVLNEGRMFADGLVKGPVVEAFKQVASIIPEDAWLDDHDALYCQRKNMHLSQCPVAFLAAN